MNNVKTTHFFALLVISLSFFLFSCQQEMVTPDYSAEQIEAAEAMAQEVVLAQAAYDEAAQLAFFTLEDKGVNKTNNFDLCADILLDTTSKTLVLDYGSGCTGPKKVERSGSIEIQYVGSIREVGGRFKVIFYDYTVNGNTLDGSITINRSSRDSNDHLTFSYKVEDGSFTSADGESVHIACERTLTWVEGEGAGDPLANVYQVEGSSQGRTSDGQAFNTQITTPLLMKSSCLAEETPFPVSGRMDIQSTEFTTAFAIDFGSGNCDKKADLIIGNRVIPIDLEF